MNRLDIIIAQMLLNLDETIRLDSIPMSFVGKRRLPGHPLPRNWVDQLSGAKKIMANKCEERSAFPVDFKDPLAIADIVVEPTRSYIP